ncbi:hypothetical protein TYRP_011802 [Tyrophagus putrescentiae]|nr:hypothetical protein TYRP_011802 [Tyrophagus putrescentiae]
MIQQLRGFEGPPSVTCHQSSIGFIKPCLTLTPSALTNDWIILSANSRLPFKAAGAAQHGRFAVFIFVFVFFVRLFESRFIFVTRQTRGKSVVQLLRSKPNLTEPNRTQLAHSHVLAKRSEEKKKKLR